MKCCLSGPTLGLYSKLNLSSETYKRLLLEARTLQTNLFGYKTHSPTSAVQIYLSTSKCEPPIIIDTGASNSLTPLSSDFKNNLIQSAEPMLTGAALIPLEQATRPPKILVDSGHTSQKIPWRLLRCTGGPLVLQLICLKSNFAIWIESC